MAWLIVIALGALSLLALYASGRCSRLALEIAGVAVLVALAGYAWQGSPNLSGHPVGGSASTPR